MMHHLSLFLREAPSLLRRSPDVVAVETVAVAAWRDPIRL